MSTDDPSVQRPSVDPRDAFAQLGRLSFDDTSMPDLLQRVADVMTARDGKRQIRQYAEALGVRHVTLAYEAVQANPRAEMLRVLGAAGIATGQLPADLGEVFAQKRTPEDISQLLLNFDEVSAVLAPYPCLRRHLLQTEPAALELCEADWKAIGAPPNGGTSWSLARRAVVERCSEASGAAYHADAREVAMAAMRRRTVTCAKLHSMATRLSKDPAVAEVCHLDYEADADAGPMPQPNAVALAAPETGGLDDEKHVTTTPTLSPVMPRRYNATTTRLRAVAQQSGPASCTRCGRNPGGEANCCGTGGAWEGSCAHSYGSLVMASAHTWDDGWKACNAVAPAAAPAATAAQREASRRRLSHLLPAEPV